MSALSVLLAQRIRRDGRQVVLWVAATGLLVLLSYVGVAGSFGSAADRAGLLAAALANPVILLFRGLPSGSDDGAFLIFLVLPWVALLAALMSTFLAVRHTRGDEEAGRAELIAATPAGRTQPLLATAIHGLLANVLVAALTGGLLLAVGLAPGGALLAGAAAGAVGITFLGVGLLAAQVTTTSRGANALSVWVVVVTYAAAGIGNALGTPSDDLTRMESSGVTWLSPFGWAENSRPFADDAVGPVLLCILAGVVAAGVAGVLTARRDLGEGLIPERHGRPGAPASLGSALGLTWRLSRGGVLGWLVAGLLVGSLSTSLASIVEQVGAQNPTVEDVIRRIAGAGDLEQGVVTTFFTMVGVMGSCCAVQVVCRARQEEAHGRAEPVLAAPVPRVGWLAGHLGIAFVALVGVATAAVAGAGAGLAARGGPATLLRDAAVAGGGQVLAGAVFLVATALVFVVAPRATIGVGWSLVLLAMLVGMFGPLFELPEWVVTLSPIGAAPVMSGTGLDPRGLSWLLPAALAGAAGSLVLMRRRELHPD